jgi:hypothetical protein
MHGVLTLWLFNEQPCCMPSSYFICRGTPKGSDDYGKYYPD